MAGHHDKQFKSGQARPEGSGRIKGTPNKRTGELVDLLKSVAYSPFEFLIRCYTDDLFHRDGHRLEVALDIRVVCAKELCGYLAPKKRSIEVSGSLTVGETPAEGAFLIGAGQTVEALAADTEPAN